MNMWLQFALLAWATGWATTIAHLVIVARKFDLEDELFGDTPMLALKLAVSWPGVLVKLWRTVLEARRTGD